MQKSDEQIVAEVAAVIVPYGCTITGIGPNSVGVQGDARVYGPSVIISFPSTLSDEEVARISNEITNLVRGVTRVLREIPKI